MYKCFTNKFGHDLRYKITGNGDSQLLIIPGGPGLTLEYLSPLHDFIDKEQFTVISYDYSGTASTTSPYLTSLSEYASELNDFIEFLDLKCTVSVVGHSAGGCILLEYLLNYPGKIDKAILANSFTSGDQIKKAVANRSLSFPKEFHDKYKSFTDTKDPALLGELIVDYWFPRHLLKFGEINEDIGTSLENYGKVEVGSHFIGNDIFNIDGAFLHWDIADRLSEIKTPTLVMSGEHDYFTKAESEQIVNSLSNASLWYSEQSSHMPMHEDQSNFIKAIENFITKS